MSKSYFPTDRAGRSAWYDNFAKEFPNVGKSLGFSDTEITNAVNDAIHMAKRGGRVCLGAFSNKPSQIGRAHV